MKTKNLFLAPALIAVLNLLPAGRVTAQTFTTIKSFGILTNVTGFNPQSTVVRGPDGTLYGSTPRGLSFFGPVAGTLFKVQSDGSGFTPFKWFTNTLEGATPYAVLVLSSNVLYGTTLNGGLSNYGTVFRVNTDGTGYTVLKHFAGADGANPAYAGLTLSGSTLYGATYFGGTSNFGTLFRVNTDGTGYTVLKQFTGGNGANPNTGLTISGGLLYGTTENGGSSGVGTVFKVNTDGTGYTLLHNFTDAPDGAYPDGVLTLSDRVLYGTTYRGGSSSEGTVFKLNTNGTGYAVLKNFATITGDGTNPDAGLALSDGVLYGTTYYGGSSGSGTVFKLSTNGTGYAVLMKFASSNGYAPVGLTLADSVLYGTTIYGGSLNGGSPGVGTVYKMNTDGTGYSALKTFDLTTLDAEHPYGLTLSGNVLYGTTFQGGSSNYGTLFKMNTDGSGYSLLKEFAFSDGRAPIGGLTLSGGVLYGTALSGGNSNSGTLFKANTDGSAFSVLRYFSSTTNDPATGQLTNSDGAKPSARLTLSGGSLYGTTSGGGSSGNGVLFQVNTDGSGYTVLKHFTGADGANPSAELTLSGSTFYGTTRIGGNWSNGVVFSVNNDGTGYAVLKHFSAGSYNPTGDYTNSDGAWPIGNLTLSGATLYGTTYLGGVSGKGKVFKLNTDGTGYTVLKDFSATTYNPSIGGRTNSDGASPNVGLTLVGGVLFGAASEGGSLGNGTVFQLNTDGTGFTVLKNFAGSPDGARPRGLTLAGSALYGTTFDGGDLGFGIVFSLSFPPRLAIAPSGTNVILSWPTNVAGFDYTGYRLQKANAITGPFADVPGSSSPYFIPITSPQQFFRLVQ